MLQATGIFLGSNHPWGSISSLLFHLCGTWKQKV